MFADIALSTGNYREIAFLDDESIRECMGFQVLGSTGKWKWDDFVVDYEMVVAIGNAQIRQRIMKQIDAVDGISRPETYIGIPVRLQVNNSKGKQNS